ncbi:MAG: RNA-binding S4 domain-containing protein [Trueperaceae bacterium]
MTHPESERDEPGAAGTQAPAAAEGEPHDAADDEIRLDDALKILGLAATGGHAKSLVQAGEVRVNDEVETRRKRKLRAGDVIEVGGEEFVVAFEEDAAIEEDAAE